LIDRRRFINSGIAYALLTIAAGRGTARATPVGTRFGPPRPFSFALLQQRAAALAKKSYVAPSTPAPDIVRTIDFDTVQKIKFRMDRSLWRAGPGPFPVAFFHLDKFVALPVSINAVSGGIARQVLYTPADFDYGATGLEQKLPATLGFSGFRVMDGRDAKTDWLAFQGASYFRSAGSENQYGASARGIAVDTGLSTKEEFPRFVEFWLEEPSPDKLAIDVYALLDGRSLTGAYRFRVTKDKGAVMDIDATLYMRSDIARLGVAPLTSMYWYGENDRRADTDWRPEIHDSDGLALWTGKGERIWRPLIDPPSLQVNSFVDINPKGFGLMQRDRSFADYQDDGAFYNRRPSIWVEPKGNWGAGAVQLVEIPTTDEIHDNIVAYWQPHGSVKAGETLPLAYRLYWQDDEPHPATDVAHVIGTRIGRGGIPGKPSPQDRNSWKFVIDFMGGPLAAMAPRFDVKPVVTLSRGTISNAYVIRVVGTEIWRAFFDVHAQGDQPMDLRCFLRLAGKTLSETWLYQYFPPG
jgi:periplasmic glucans biosynthesis protein